MQFAAHKQIYIHANNNIMATTAEIFCKWLLRRRLQQMIVCTNITIWSVDQRAHQSACHHVRWRGRLHARPLTWGRRLERRRGWRQGRCRCYRLEIVVDVVSKRYGGHVAALAMSPELELPCRPAFIDWTHRPHVLMKSTCDDARDRCAPWPLWRRRRVGPVLDVLARTCWTNQYNVWVRHRNSYWCRCHKCALSSRRYVWLCCS